MLIQCMKYEMDQCFFSPCNLWSVSSLVWGLTAQIISLGNCISSAARLGNLPGLKLAKVFLAKGVHVKKRAINSSPLGLQPLL